MRKENMPSCEDSIVIEAAPEMVWDFFQIQENHKAWHPEDRVLARWIKGNPLEVGSICDIEDYIQGKLHKMKDHYTKIVTAAKPRRAIGA
jgi:hypothetical protein